jgi:thiamine-monophosphate kinase
MFPSAEDRLVDWLKQKAPGGHLIGDDAALLADLGPTALSIDQQIEGTHFPPGLPPSWLARRLLEVCLSDLAACGAVPRHVALALAAPKAWPHRQFLRAFATACRRREVQWVGGDIGSAPQTSCALVVLGEPPSRGRFVRRDTAQSGDRLWLGGTVGLSAAGRLLASRGVVPHGRSIPLPRRARIPPQLASDARRAVRAHFAPQAQIELGLWLARRKRAAAIDVSDGFGLDLARLCGRSGVGARVQIDKLPLDRSLIALAPALRVDPLELALGGGEDYVVLFALPPRIRPPEQLGCIACGSLTNDTTLLLESDDEVSPLEPRGWSHL